MLPSCGSVVTCARPTTRPCQRLPGTGVCWPRMLSARLSSSQGATSQGQAQACPRPGHTRSGVHALVHVAALHRLWRACTLSPASSNTAPEAHATSARAYSCRHAHTCCANARHHAASDSASSSQICCTRACVAGQCCRRAAAWTAACSSWATACLCSKATLHSSCQSSYPHALQRFRHLLMVRQHQPRIRARVQ